MVNTLLSSDETKAKRKLHSSLVRGVQMKSTVARTLCPKDLYPILRMLDSKKRVLKCFAANDQGFRSHDYQKPAFLPKKCQFFGPKQHFWGMSGQL